MTGFEVLDLLGEGSSAIVHRARRTDRAGQIVALKTSRCGDRSAAAALRSEAKALQILDHPNVIRLVAVVDDGDTVSLALPIAAGGSLATRLTTRTWNADEVLTAARELAGALAECHRRNVVHGDVATTNVLVGADGSMLLADFGTPERAGTPGFAAPELEAGGKATAASDVFGLGKVLECLVAAANNARVIGAARAAIATDPKARPSAEEILALLHGPSPVRTPGGEAAEMRTTPFGPRSSPSPSPSPEIHASSRRLLALYAPRTAVGLGFVMVVTGLLQLAWRNEAAHAGQSCHTTAQVAPPNGELIEADVDGDGCPNVIVRVGSVVTVGSDRFVIGHPGDELYIFDWDCDGDATPGVFRPASRRLAVFDSWPEPGAPVPPPYVTSLAAAPAAPEC